MKTFELSGGLERRKNVGGNVVGGLHKVLDLGIFKTQSETLRGVEDEEAHGGCVCVCVHVWMYVQVRRSYLGMLDAKR
jgi:hypothetical protein